MDIVFQPMMRSTDSFIFLSEVIDRNQVGLLAPPNETCVIQLFYYLRRMRKVMF